MALQQTTQSDEQQTAQVVADIVGPMLSNVSRSLDFHFWAAIRAQRHAGSREAEYVEDRVRSGQPWQQFINPVISQDDALRNRYRAIISGGTGNGNGNGSHADDGGGRIGEFINDLLRRPRPLGRGGAAPLDCPSGA